MRHAACTSVLVSLIVLLSGCQANEPIVLLSVSQDQPDSPAQAVSKSTRAAANAVLASLTDEQRESVQHAIEAPLRKDWHFVPRQRAGVMLGELSPEQKTLVHNLMQTALSDSGYLKATDIIWLETVLYEMTNQNPLRDPGRYALQIFGDPADETAAWGWRLEGHHLSLNLTYTPDGIGVTPLFFGTNPAVVQEGPLAGKRILADAHNLAVELAKSMSDEQRKKMMLDQMPRDVITGPGREASLGKPIGLKYAEMSHPQRLKLYRLLHVHCDHFEIYHRSRLWQAAITSDKQVVDGVTALSFAWAGPIDADKPFYYRIHSPKFVIEYACQGRNHVHTVMHDLTDPLQEDLLKKHFEQHEHE